MRNGLLKAAREIRMMGVEYIRGKAGIGSVGDGESGWRRGEERVRKRNEESEVGR